MPVGTSGDTYGFAFLGGNPPLLGMGVGSPPWVKGNASGVNVLVGTSGCAHWFGVHRIAESEAGERPGVRPEAPPDKRPRRVKGCGAVAP